VANLFDNVKLYLPAAAEGFKSGSKLIADQESDARDAELKKFLLGQGKSLDAQNEHAKLAQEAEIKAAQREDAVNKATGLRKLLGKDAKVSVGDVTMDNREQGGGIALTPGQEAADKKFAQEYADYTAGGGYAGVDKSLHALEDAAQNLPDPNFLQRAAGILPKSIRDVAMPESAAREDEVRGALQDTLRKTLGPQFTEREGEQVMARAYNPRLPKAENVKRVMAEVQKLRTMADQKKRATELFERQGTLVGLQGAQNMGHATPSAPPADTVTVMSPDGRLGRIPRANLQKALQRGYQVQE
jgi:hypothetical protein